MAKLRNKDEHKKRIYDNKQEDKCSEEVFADDELPFDPAFPPLPSDYNMDMLVVMPINPWQVFCYWEISESSLEKFKASLGETDFSSCYLKLSLYLKDRETSTIPKKPLWQQSVKDAEQSSNWYVTFDNPVTYEYPLDNFYAELGYHCPDGTFHVLVRNMSLEELEKSPGIITLEKEETITAMEPSPAQQLSDEKIPQADIKPELETALEVKEPELAEIEGKLKLLSQAVDIDEAVELMKALELPEALTESEESLRDYFEKKIDELTRPPEEEPSGTSGPSGSGFMEK